MSEAVFAVVFPGQGSQVVGMGKDVAAAHDEARRTFAAADAALGEAFSDLLWAGRKEDLELTANTQPGILTCSIAIWRVLASHGVEARYVAGHSLGEYSALVAAGCLDFADAVRAVRQRGQFMQQAVPAGQGTMSAVVNLDSRTIAEICAAVSSAGDCGTVAPANFNSPEQTVISGHAEAVRRAGERAQAAGGRVRVIPLPVSAPFHSPLMLPAAEKLRPVLQAMPFQDLRVPLVTNVDALPIQSGSEAREALMRQVDQPVRWVESVECLAGLGVTDFVEVGPGAVLSGLIRRIRKGVKTHAVQDVKTIAAFLDAYRAA